MNVNKLTYNINKKNIIILPPSSGFSLSEKCLKFNKNYDILTIIRQCKELTKVFFPLKNKTKRVLLFINNIYYKN